ncbi:MAG: MBL fold metallo-hydrolase [Saprospirales bacterium]|nr:MBL fold metallo-hydrolase [Saprospirales bacterium]
MLYLVLSLFLSLYPTTDKQPLLIVLGDAQDAGYPQADCHKDCCAQYWDGGQLVHRVTSLGLYDPASNQTWLIDATPDFRDQLKTLQTFRTEQRDTPLDGIFLTHAHIGHYTGLMQLGREVMGAKEVPVYAMPRMRTFLEGNGPWSQLVELKNIAIQPLKADSAVQLTETLTITPFLVPHRDEYSETVGYVIAGPNKSILFIPDIDKWEKWDRNIIEEIKKVDIALIDGTFYQDGELPGRDMSEIPHPFIQETMNLLGELPSSEKAKVHFIHFNHTNPLIWDVEARNALKEAGYRAAREGQVFFL